MGRRQQHLAVRIQAVVEGADAVGELELRIDPRHAVRLEIAEGQVRAIAAIGGVQAVLGEAPARPGAALELRTVPPRVPSFGADQGPDEVVAGLAGPGGFVELGRLDGRYLSTEVAAASPGASSGSPAPGTR